MPEPFNWIEYLTIPPATPESLWPLEELGNVIERVEITEDVIPISDLVIPSRLSLLPLYNLERNTNGGINENPYT